MIEPGEGRNVAEANRRDALARVSDVLAERPDGKIPYERLALAAVQRLEAECLNWRRTYGLQEEGRAR